MYPATTYPVQFSVDYPDRPLNRATTALRIFVAIPIHVRHRHGRAEVAAANARQWIAHRDRRIVFVTIDGDAVGHS